MARHVRAGDTVIVTAGDYKGQTGEVLRVEPSKDRVVVKGINLKTKHIKPTQASPQGGVVKVEGSIHISNVSVAVDGKPTRVRFETGKDGKKSRVAVRGGEKIPSMSRKRKGERSKAETL